MTTKEFLSNICQNAFGNAFQAEIRNIYTRSVLNCGVISLIPEFQSLYKDPGLMPATRK